ncbi:MAG: hypothetical protein OEZ11_14305 [Gammaproteobacteria bacterium]|nr:hypothetical protein [Gammaproteobacteria bacterium]
MTTRLFPLIGLIATLLVGSVSHADVLGKPRPTPLAGVNFPAATQWFGSADGVPLGVAVRTERGMTLAFIDGREILLDRFATIVVAEEAGGFVTFTPEGGQVAEDWTLTFYDRDGKQLQRYFDRFGWSRVVVSGDGRTVAVAGLITPAGEGAAREQRRTAGLVLYDGTGKPLADSELPPGSRITAMTADAGGELIAVALELADRKTDARWLLRVYQRSGKEAFAVKLRQPVQGLRFASDRRALLLLVPGGMRVLDLETREPAAIIRLPAGHYIADSGRVFLHAGKLFAVTEQPAAGKEGMSTWSLLAADVNAAELKPIAEGDDVPSRRSPALSRSPALGAKEWPALISTDRIVFIDPGPGVEKQ